MLKMILKLLRRKPLRCCDCGKFVALKEKTNAELRRGLK